MTQALPQVDVAELQAVLRAVRVRIEEAQAERPRGLAVGVLGFLALSLGFLHVAQGHAWSLSPRTVPPAKENDMKAISAMAMAAAMGSGALAQNAVQWRVEDGGNGHWYQKLPLQASRDAHRQWAVGHGADLVSIVNQQENDLVQQIAQGDSVWIGGIQMDGACEPGCGWGWLDGSTWSFVRWEGTEPNDGGGGTPGEQGIEFRSNGYWNDFWIWMTSRAVVEWSADCNSDGIVDYGQIRDGELDDANTNNIPDCCEQSTACGCVGDADGSGFVNGVDLAAVLNVWGTDGGKYPGADINRDGTVNATDLAAVLNGWGACP